MRNIGGSSPQVGDVVLVIDSGGGTTDFSLIGVAEEKGSLVLDRLAVGSHLLLGGDNIDLSMAYFAKNKLEEQGHAIDDWQFQSLISSCRRAKEVLMAEDPPKTFDVTVLGRGSRLIGNTLKVSLGLQEEVKTFILEGFAPLITPQERSKHQCRAGIQQIGLPYATDPRLTSQMAKFLSMTGEDDSGLMENFILPTHVLFNGGTTKSAALRHRLVEQLNQWATGLNKKPVKMLADADYDYAVSRGAVSYVPAHPSRRP